jgi:hypothetical protein
VETSEPWYFTTGEREAAMVATTCGRLLERLVGRPSCCFLSVRDEIPVIVKALLAHQPSSRDLV